MSMRLPVCFTALICFAIAANAEEAASVAVTTQPVVQGTLTHNVSGYGTAMPALDAATTLSIQAPGQVTHFLVNAGATVKRGQALLDYALTPAAVATYKQTQSALKLAHDEHNHIQQLLAQQLATRDQLAQADKSLDDAQSAIQALRQQQADAATTVLKAPFDGIVTAIQVVQGDTLSAGAALLTLSRSNGMVIGVGLEPAERDDLKPGARVTLTPMGAGHALHGTVRRVADAIDLRTRLIDVDVVADGVVMPGAAFRADIDVGTWHGWLIPRDALIGSGDSWHVFQVDHGKAVEVPVTIVGQSATTTAVSGALVAGRPLVIDGSTQLENGMDIRAANEAGSVR
jgi:RND family efflux transporter MFP subunit